MGVNIKGGNNSTGLANVSSTYELQVTTPQEQTQAGFVQLSTENDAGDVSGSRFTMSLETSDDYRLRVGLDQTAFNMSFEGGAVPQAVIQQNTTTMTTSISGGYLILNAANATASGNMAAVRTYRHFPTFGTYPCYLDIWLRETAPTTTNVISEWGFFHLATTTSVTAPTDGVFFRRLSGGQLQAVVNYNGSEAATVSINTTNVPPRDGVGTYDATEVNHYLITYHNDVCRFWINDVLVASIDCPGSQPAFTSSSNSPVHFRVYNSGVASGSGRRLEIGYINVGFGDQESTKPWSHALCGSGQGSYQTQLGTASAQTALWANSAAPTAISTPSNIAITAGYSTLGGIYLFNAVAGGETDYLLFSYQNPAPSSTIPGKTLYVTGIRIGEMLVTGAAVATTGTIFQFAAGVASTASTLLTTDSATTVKSRIVPLGSMGFVVGDAIGKASPGFQVDFSSAPLVVPANLFLSIVLRCPVGTATASQVYRGTVTIIGYFE